MYHIDHDDEAVRGMLVVEKGTKTWPPPAPAPTPLAAASVVDDKPTLPEVVPPTPYQLYMKSAIKASAGGAGVLALGAVAPDQVGLSVGFWCCVGAIVGDVGCWCRCC
jgi:NAD(P) transhydrogenase